MNKRILFFGSITLVLGLITYTQLFEHSRSNTESIVSERSHTFINTEHTEKQTVIDTNKAHVLPPPVEERQNMPEQITLWNKDLKPQDSGADRIYTTRIDPQQLNQFQVGQTLTFTTPHNTTPLHAEIENTYNQGHFAKVWHASVNGRADESLTITQGKIETHLVIISNGKVYTAIIDNKSGDTVIVDQADLAEKTIPYEDGVSLPVDPPSLPTL